MAGQKRACIVYVKEDGCDPSSLKAKLEGQGYEVILCPVAAQEAEAAKAGDLSSFPPDIRDALENADLCLVLLSECAPQSGEVGEAVGCAVNGGGRIVGVWPAGFEEGKVPEALVDYGCAIAREDGPEIDGVIAGDDGSWTDPKGKPAVSPPTSHQPKC